MEGELKFLEVIGAKVWAGAFEALVLLLTPHSKPRRGHLPTDCRVATRLPAATPPPLEMAATDIILAAMDEAAIPALVKPMAPSTVGTAPTATAAMGEELLRGG